MHYLWLPRVLNWWIGSIFALGSALFMLGSVLVLAPSVANAWSLDTRAVNAVFFAGSIPFTTAAYLQLFQAANAVRGAGSATALFGWYPGDIGWLSCALQFGGTLLFNINTLDGLLPAQDWLQQNLDIWLPDLIGSLLFLLSGYLAFAEICRSWWGWQPRSLAWWITSINLLGCIAFMISALLAFTWPTTKGTSTMALAVVFTLLGALGFLLGSLLLVKEADATEAPAGI